MYDAIVIGLGGIGSAALHQLAKRGLNVLGLEQFSVGHAFGSSHGETRVVRRAYFEHEHYVPLVLASYGLWRDLEAECGQDLLIETGMILAGKPDSDVIAGSKRAAMAHGLDFEELNPTEAAQRYPGFLFDNDMTVLVDPRAGYLHVEACVNAHVRRAIARGAEIIDECTVNPTWQSTDGTVKIETNRGSYEAKNLVVCAGPWSDRFIPDLGITLTVDRVVLGWYRMKNAGAHRNAPVFGYDLGGDDFYYGFSNVDDDCIKIAKHGPVQTGIDPDTIDRSFNLRDFEGVQRLVNRYLPNVSTEVVRHAVCMYTMTKTSHFVVDTHPEQNNVHIACGFSGHGFKFAPVIGAILADRVVGGTTSYPADFLTIAGQAGQL